MEYDVPGTLYLGVQQCSNISRMSTNKHRPQTVDSSAINTQSNPHDMAIFGIIARNEIFWNTCLVANHITLIYTSNRLEY